MKNLFKFIFVYIIIIISIVSSYLQTLSEKYKDLSFTQSEINGVTYLKSIYHLGISSILYHGDFIFEDDKTIVSQSKKNIQKNIDTILAYQKNFPEFKNNEFNEKMNKILLLNSDEHNKFYDFFNDINHENYRLGDISKILFEVDRKAYFLGSLITHYMPEYLLSTLISHNIIEELVRKGSISGKKQEIFIEQNKLIYLSADEISAITDLIKKYEDTEILSYLIRKIYKRLIVLPNNIINMKNNPKLAKKYLNITHEILDLSYQLNDTNINILKGSLQKRKASLKNTILFYQITLIFLLFIVSLIMFLFYSSFTTNLKNIEKLELEKYKTQKALEFKSQFLSNMSHEIRTPLNSIISLISLTLKTKLNEKQNFMLKKVNSASTILLGVINDILDISKAESGNMHIENEPFNLKESVNNIYDMLLIKAQENSISLELEYENSFNTYRLGDSLRISQILTNLVSNAIKFTENGNVTIQIKDLTQNRFRFIVKDTGIGIKQEYVKTLFDEFTQADMSTSRKYGGTGLGLSISKKLVDLMGGKIWVDSVHGEGSVFGFIIPLEEDPIDRSKEEVTDDNINEITKKINTMQDIKILVAEDNKMNQMVLKMLLEESNIVLDFANDGQIATDKFNQNEYSLILMDIQMPNLNGYEAATKIRSIDTKIPIIALSANAMAEDIKQALDSGMDDYLTKPIDLDKLYLTLDKYLG